MKHFE
jgi:chromosome transmission fidelity protein 8